MADAPLNLETAETSEAASGCAVCGSALEGSYWLAGHAPVCASCKQRIEAVGTEGSPLSRFAKASLLGLAGGLAGALLWYLVIRFVHIEAALIAIAMGWLVGAGVRRGSSGRGGLFYQALGVGITYLCVGVAYMGLILNELGADRAADLELVRYPLALALGLAAPFMQGFENILGILIIAFGLYQAWRMNRRAVIDWAGPIAVSAPTPPADA